MRFVGSPATVTPPAGLEAFDLTTPANGGFNPWQIPGAIRHLGVTYVPFTTGTSGDCKLVAIKDDGTILGPWTFGAGFQRDAHSVPLLKVLPNGRLITVYNKHNAAPINLRLSTNVLDASGTVTFGSAVNLDSQIGGAWYTDVQVHYLSSTGLLYMIFRYEPTAGSNSRWAIATCDPANPTTGWSANEVFFYQAGARTYVISWSNGVDRIDIAGMENPGDVGHAYFDGTSWFASDGTGLGAVTPSVPLNMTRITPVYSTHPSYASNLAYIAGNPVMVGTSVDGSNLGVWYARWDGAAWGTTEIVADVGVGYEYSGAGSGFGAYGQCVDDVDPNLVWLVRDVSGQPELFLYETADGGATFTAIWNTESSTGLMLQPIVVRGAGDACRVVLQRGGSWTSYTNWNQGIMGVRAA